MKNYAIILASGTGSRCGLDIPKQFYKISGKTVLEYSIEAFQKNKYIDSIIIVSNPDFVDLTKELSKKYSKVSSVLSGGQSRQESSSIGVNAVKEEFSNVLIHDAVRPFVTQKIINGCIDALLNNSAINVVIDSADTIVEIDENGIIKSVPNRNYLKRCQTPQCFRLSVIKNAHKLALKDNSEFATDDCGLVLKYNLADIYVITGDENNIKITYPSDIKISEEILKKIDNN